MRVTELQQFYIKHIMSLILVMSSIFLTSCGVLLEYTKPKGIIGLRISAHASEPEYDGIHLKTQITVDVADARGPIVDYLPSIEVESSSVSGQSFVSKLVQLFSSQTLLVSSICSRTDVRGRAECFLNVLPPQDGPLEIKLMVSGVEVSLESPLVVFPSPTITSLSLSDLSFDISESLAITGTQFREGMQFLINGESCLSLVVHSQTSATCHTPLHSVGGPYNATLTTPDKQEITLSGSLSFVDKTSPTAAWVLVPPARSNQDSFSFQFSGGDNYTASHNLVFECQMDNSGWNACSSPYLVSGFSAESIHTFQVRVQDEAGLITVLSHAWTYDTTAPTLDMSGFVDFMPSPSSHLGLRSLTFGGEDIVNYKYRIINSGSCGSVDFSAAPIYSISSPVASFTPTVDGTYVVCAVGQDSAGNWQEDAHATASPALVIDTVVTPFVALSISPVSPSQQLAPIVTGTTESLASVALFTQVSCGGAAVASATANALGEFSLTSPALGAEGTHVYSVRATDLAGNTTCSSALNYQLDTSPPLLTFTTPVATRGGETLQVEGTCEAALTVIASGAIVGTPSVSCLGGVFSLMTHLSAGEGVKSITLTSTDLAGNISSVNRDFIRDDTSPLLTIVSPANGFRSTGNLTLNGSCGVDVGDSATVNISGSGLAASPQSTVCTAGSYSLGVTLSAGEGSKAIVVEQEDSAGNTTTIHRSFIKDTTAPLLTITDPAEGFRAPSGVTLTGTCGVIAGDNPTITIAGTGVNGAPITTSCVSGAFSEEVFFTFGDGVKNIVVQQIDDLGHSSTDNRNFERDSSAPTLTISSPLSNSRYMASLTIAGSCGSGIDDLPTLTLGGAGLQGPMSTTCNAGTYSEVITLTFGEGSKVITVSQSNTIGNTATVSRTFIRDNTAPVPTFTGPAVNSRFQSVVMLTGTCGIDTGDSGTLNLGGTGLDSPLTTDCIAGTFSEEITLTAGEGTKNITVTQADSAGHSLSVDRDYIRDNTAPILVINSPSSDTPYQTGATITGTCTSGVGDSALLTIGGAGVASPASATCVGDAFSVDVVFTAGAGTKSITISQEDSAGNIGSGSLQLIRDNSGPVLSLTSLAGGQIVRGNQDTAITWTASDSVEMANNPITLQYSLNGGTNWTTIAANIANTGSYTWSMPGFNSSTARIRIIAIDKAGNSTTATSTTNFTIDSSSPILTLTSLTGGQVIRGSSVVDISWSATDANFASTPITLFYSSDEGVSWNPIGTAMANSGVYAWTVPDVDSTHYRVRVVATDVVSQATSASSTANITIDRTVPVVSLTSLTGGQVILGNSSYNITWVATDSHFGPTPITIEYSSDSGSSWTTIASNRSNSGTYAWDVNVTDGDHYRVRVRATDAVGLTTTSASTSDFSVSSLAPNLTQTTTVTPYYSNTATTVTYGGLCEDGYDIFVTGAQATSFACVAGIWTWTTDVQTTDGVREYTFSQTNAVLTTSRTVRWVRDTTDPVLSAVIINGGDENTPSAIVSVAVTANEGSGLKIRMLNAATHDGNCPDYADDNWVDQTNATTVRNHILSSGDGLKKVCVWLKDQAGNHSVIAGAGVQGQDMDKIDYSSGSAPVATQFEVINDSGGDFQGTLSANTNDPLRITWTVSDAEGLANNPIYLDYTQDGVTWIPIESGYGGLSGNPLSYSSVYYGFSAPASTFFRIRLRVKDLAGNTSLEYYSNSLNTTPWSVFAGNKGRGEGGSAKSALVTRTSRYTSPYAMNPKNGDVYYLDNSVGLFKVSAATGIVTKILRDGTGNITGSGVLSSTHRVRTVFDHILFDNNGYLYLITSSSSSSTSETHRKISRRIIRINPETLEFTTYLTGGSYYGQAGTTTSNIFILYGPTFAFDESNSLYFLTSCTPGTFTLGTSTARMVKVTQNAEGGADAFSAIAGNCVRANPTSGQPALNVGLQIHSEFYTSGRIAVWGNGNYIYYQSYDTPTMFKIINGIIYTGISSMTDASFVYNPVDGKLYTANGPLKRFTPNLAGAGGDVQDMSYAVSGSSVGDGCGDDGTPSTDVCINAYGVMVTPSGKVFFVDGRDGAATLRYFDDNSNIQTLVGAPSYSGNGGVPSLTKGIFGPIYYKKSSELLGAPHQYPEGLYFTEIRGGVFGYFSEALGVSVNLWGNQSGNTPPITTGSPIGSGHSMGVLAYIGDGDLRAFTFDNTGRPWLRYRNSYLITLDENRQIIERQASSGVLATWHFATEGTDPYSYRLQRYGGWQNLNVYNNNVFLLGVHYDTGNVNLLDTNPKLRIFDYANSNVVHLMGDVSGGPAAEQLVPGSLQNTPISSLCMNKGCAIQHSLSQNRLYLAEGSTLRYITDPLVPNNHTLRDVFTAVSAIQNFILSEDGKYIFYTQSGALYCHALAAIDDSTICKNDPQNHINLGPPAGMDTIDKGPNQMTWKNNSILFISTQKGEIYQYTVHH